MISRVQVQLGVTSRVAVNLGAIPRVKVYVEEFIQRGNSFRAIFSVMVLRAGNIQNYRWIVGDKVL